MKTLYEKAVFKENTNVPPIWMMRQAGRYHSHYQNLKRKYTFMDLCKMPEIACETTMGPIRDFDFDAAILFSDLLFPLEALGMGLEYSPGPKLGWHLTEPSLLSRLNPKNKSTVELVQELSYQGEALRLIRKALPKEKSLLGFVGAPLTLFYYAAEGSHQGKLQNARKGLDDGRFDGFCKHIVPFLIENLSLQARNGADAIAIMDTCAGEVEPWVYRERVLPALKEVMVQFRRLHPQTPLVYYSKGTGPTHWQHLYDLPFECLGVDWNTDLSFVLNEFGARWSIQGNFDPHLMLERNEAVFQKSLEKYFEPITKIPREKLRGWVSGLGHGILQWTPEQNVKKFIQYHRELFKTQE